MRHRLHNGLSVIIAPQPHLHSVCISAFIKVGSRYETREKNGISHFLEHMLFRGTKTHPSAYAFNDAVETLGGMLQAATHADFTVYQVQLPPESATEGVALLAEMFAAPVWTGIETEKDIVRAEILEAVDEDGRNVDPDDLSREHVFGAHPLGFKITGDAENVTQFSLDDLAGHLAAHYGAENMVVVATGAVDGSFLEAARASFGVLPPGRATFTDTPSAFQVGPSYKHTSSQGSQTDIRISFVGFGEKDPRRRALQFLTRVLDDGMSTRLHRRICDEKGLAYEVFAGLDLYEDCGIFDLGAAVEPSRTLELIREALSLVRELATSDIGPEELAKAKKRYGWELRAIADDSVGLASFHGTNELFDLGESLETLPEKIAAITSAELRAIAADLFRPERLCVTTVGTLEEAELRAIDELVRAYRTA